MKFTHSAGVVYGRLVAGWVYFVVCPANNEVFIKVGVTSNLDKRIRAITSNCPIPAKTVASVVVYSRKIALKIEKQVLKQFASNRVRGEWLRFTADDKAKFNIGLNSILAAFSTPSVRLQVTTSSIAGYLAEEKRKLDSWKADWAKVHLGQKGLRKVSN